MQKVIRTYLLINWQFLDPKELMFLCIHRIYDPIKMNILIFGDIFQNLAQTFELLGSDPHPIIEHTINNVLNASILYLYKM